MSKGKKTAAQVAKSKALNAKYRAEAAALKRAGILSEKVNARKNITRATRTKINKYRDVLEGRAIVVKAPRDVLAKYRDTGVLRTTSRVAVVPKSMEGERAKISRGLIQIVRPMKNGEEERLILPFALTGIPELVERLKTDPTIDGLKNGDEMFSFRLYGHNAMQGFVDQQEFADYVERNYKHLFSPKASHDAVRHLTLQRFKPRPGWELRNLNAGTGEGPETVVRSNEWGGEDARGRSRQPSGTYETQRARKKAAQAKERRNKETPEARQLRLSKQKLRTARNRQRKFEEK